LYITQYILKNRNGKKTKVGLLLGCVINNKIRIGYSLCCKDDEFDADYALALASIRALDPREDVCPPSIENDAYAFAERCARYFKGKAFYQGEDAHKISYEGTVLPASCVVEVM
jgi:hypothetical protein